MEQNKKKLIKELKEFEKDYKFIKTYYEFKTEEQIKEVILEMSGVLAQMLEDTE